MPTTDDQKAKAAAYMRQYRARRSFGSSQAIEAAVPTMERSIIPSTSLDENENVSTFSREETYRIARYLVTNYPLFERILTTVENYGISTGITVNATTLDPEFNESATNFFNIQWASNVFCFANNNYNFFQAQKIIERCRFVDGDVFILQTSSANGWPQQQIITADQVRTEDDDGSIDGVYIDSNGKKLAYNVYTGDTKTVVDASNLFQIMKFKKGPNQLRGLSEFTACLNNARDHKDINKLQKIAFKQKTSLSFVVTKNTGDGSNGLFGKTLPLNTTSKDGKTEPHRMGTGVERILPGATAYMKPGEKVDVIESKGPNADYQSFLDSLAKETCLAIGLSYEFVVSTKGMNSVGVRFIIQDSDKFFSGVQNEMIDGYIRRTYVRVISVAIKNGKIKPCADTTPDGQPINQYEASFTKPQSITVDQSKVSAADIALMDAGLLTEEGYWSARGKNWIQQKRQRAKEIQLSLELEKEFGLPAGALWTPKVAGPAAPMMGEADPETDGEDNTTGTSETDSTETDSTDTTEGNE